MISGSEKEKLRTLTVEVLLSLRAEYLATSSPNVLKHWDLLQARMRSAARTCATPEEWATTIARKLQIGTLGVSSSRSLADLADYVREKSCAAAWLDLTERETGYLMALCRLAAEQRKAAREAEAAKEQ